MDREGKLSAIALKIKDINTMDQTKNLIRASIPKENFVLGSITPFNTEMNARRARAKQQQGQKIEQLFHITFLTISI